MKPRALRHLFEKTAKVLVTIQKHTPEVECAFDEAKGDHGHLVIDFGGSGMSRTKMQHLGKDLEGKGYRFTENRSPWLGQTTYRGRAEDKPTIIFTVPITKDRLAINEGTTDRPISFAEELSGS